MKRCNECSKQYSQMNKNPEGGCTPPVIQINNDPGCVLFHKVVFPASLGDDTTNPPSEFIGKYKNVLLVYEANNHSYMFSSDGVPTFITGEKGDQGDQGDQGEPGETGPAGTIEIGETTTGEPGTDASVENVGTPENAILNFTIPQGEKGEQGYMNEQDVRDVVDTIVPEDFFDNVSNVSECGETFTLDDVVGGEKYLFELHGNSFQQTYSGKNLFGATLAQLKTFNTAGSWDANDAYTYRGVKYTPIYENNCLLRIELSGTATANSSFVLCKISASDVGNIVTIGNTYTLSGCPAGGSTSTYYLRVQEQPYKQLYTETGAGYSRAFPTLSTGATELREVIGVDNGTNVTGKAYYPQFESGSSSTSYEPFVGGVPSPSVLYPQPIQVVTGTQTISVNGSVFDIELGNVALVGIDGVNDYIYKDGGQWKIHRAIGQTADQVGSTGITINDMATNGSFRSYCGGTLSGTTISYGAALTESNTIYYELSQAFDEVILDGTLITELESIALENGTNTINITSDGIVGDVCIGGYKNNWLGTIASIEKTFDTIASEKKGMWGISRSQYGYGTGDSDNSHYLMYSDDGITWQYVGEKMDKLTSDASSVCEINGIYYYVGNNTYQYSTDMVNWSDPQKIINETGRPIWAAWFYYDATNDDIYCYMSRQDPIDPDSTATNHKIVYLVGKQNPDGTINFENSFHELLTSEDESYIDPSVIYDPVWGYLFACKVNTTSLPDEVGGTVRIYEMSNLTTIGERKLTLSGSGTEAPQLITDGQGNISVYVQDYAFLNSMNYKFGTDIGKTIPSNSCVIRLSDRHRFTTDKTNARILLKDPLSLRHAGVSYCSHKAYSLLKKIGIKPVTPMSNQYMADNVGLTFLDLETEGGTYYITNHPNAVYIVGGPNSLKNITLIPVCAYDHEPFKIMLTKVKITWGGDFLPSWYGVKTLENTDTIFNYIEFMPLTNGTVRPPYNGTV